MASYAVFQSMFLNMYYFNRYLLKKYIFFKTSLSWGASFYSKVVSVVDIRYKVKKKLLGRNTHKYLLRLETPKTCGKKINFNLENILIKKKNFGLKIMLW